MKIMPDANSNAALNDLLVLVGRSLLQYAIECWPWAGADDDPEHRAFEELSHDQRATASRIAILLDKRGWPVDFGLYPDWSELHYVSLDYLLKKVIADEEELVAAIERAAPACQSDPEAKAIVSELLADEKQRLARLREIASSRRAGSGVPALR